VGYSNADLEAVVLLAHDLAYDQERAEHGAVTAEVFERAALDYLPARDEGMLRYMELLAVFEASNRRMLPAKYCNLSNDELDQALREARRNVSLSSSGRTL